MISYKIKLVLIPHARSKACPGNLKAILRKTGSEEYYSFKLNGHQNMCIPAGEDVLTELSFVVGDRPKLLKDDSEFEIIENGILIGVGRFYE